MISERQIGKVHKKLKLSIDRSSTSLRSQNSKKKFLSVITPSNKPAKKSKTIREMKLQVLASNTSNILSIKDLVKEKQVFSKEVGWQIVQKWQQGYIVEGKNDLIGDTTIGAESALVWQQPDTPIYKLINEKKYFK